MVSILKTRVIFEHVYSEVGGHVVVYGVTHPCQMWSMVHVSYNTHKRWATILYLHHHPWTTTPMTRTIVQETLCSNIQGNI